MVFDYEAAWADLLQLLEESPRPNWGARQLRDEMGKILSRRRVVEAGLPQTLRLYGVETEERLRRELVNQRGSEPTPSGIVDSGATVFSDPAHRLSEEDIDERRDDRNDGVGDCGRSAAQAV